MGSASTSLTARAFFPFRKKQNKNLTRLAELIEWLQKIDCNSRIAELNEFTINDNNGGRIKM